MKEIKDCTNSEILVTYSQIMKELKSRGIIRTNGNIIGDYTEWLVAEMFDLKLMTNSNAGYDAIDENGVTYQIKARYEGKDKPNTRTRQLSNLHYDGAHKEFDYLVGIIYDENYHVKEAYCLPWQAVLDHMKYSKSGKAYRLNLMGAVIQDNRCENITYLF